MRLIHSIVVSCFLLFSVSQASGQRLRPTLLTQVKAKMMGLFQPRKAAEQLPASASTGTATVTPAMMGFYQPPKAAEQLPASASSAAPAAPAHQTWTWGVDILTQAKIDKERAEINRLREKINKHGDSFLEKYTSVKLKVLAEDEMYRIPRHQLGSSAWVEQKRLAMKLQKDLGLKELPFDEAHGTVDVEKAFQPWGPAATALVDNLASLKALRASTSGRGSAEEKALRAKIKESVRQVRAIEQAAKDSGLHFSEKVHPLLYSRPAWIPSQEFPRVVGEAWKAIRRAAWEAGTASPTRPEGKPRH